MAKTLTIRSEQITSEAGPIFRERTFCFAQKKKKKRVATVQLSR